MSHPGMEKEALISSIPASSVSYVRVFATHLALHWRLTSRARSRPACGLRERFPTRRVFWRFIEKVADTGPALRLSVALAEAESFIERMLMYRTRASASARERYKLQVSY